jgi:hypothetical protein
MPPPTQPANLRTETPITPIREGFPGGLKSPDDAVLESYKMDETIADAFRDSLIGD